MSPESIIAERMIKDHLCSNIDKSLLLAVGDARGKWVQHNEEEGRKKANSVAETEAVKAVMERKDALQQIQRDLAIINAGVEMVEKSVEEGSNEIVKLVLMTTLDTQKLLRSQAKLAMGMKRKNEHNLELEVLNKKKKSLVESKDNDNNKNN